MDQATLAAILVGSLSATNATFGLLAAWRRDRVRGWLCVGLSALTAVGGVAGSTLALREAFNAVAQADPAEKATILSHSIANAILPAETGWVGAFVGLAVGLVSLWRSRMQDSDEETPPTDALPS